MTRATVAPIFIMLAAMAYLGVLTVEATKKARADLRTFNEITAGD